MKDSYLKFPLHEITRIAKDDLPRSEAELLISHI